MTCSTCSSYFAEDAKLEGSASWLEAERELQAALTFAFSSPKMPSQRRCL
jgi:hypothetical protein